MNNDELLHILERAEGNDALLGLATVDLAFRDASLDHRDVLRFALQASAIPHWIDSSIQKGC